MNTQATAGSPVNHRFLYQQAMQASLRVRSAAGADLKSPICIYALCKARDVTVRFNAISMEGMYDRSPRPRIHLSALRPLVRRVYNCGHELGHHEFGHGSTIDELRDEASTARWNHPDEILADAFAAFTLMPTLGIREAFAKRGVTAENAPPAVLYAIACNFGVGLSTLVTHLTFGIHAMSRFRHAAVKRVSPQSIRTDFLEQPTSNPLIIVDEQWTAPSLDAEEGHLIWLPSGIQVAGKVLMAERSVHGGTLYRAIAPGIGRAYASTGVWAAYIRVARREYVGLAEYRHLEETPDD